MTNKKDEAFDKLLAKSAAPADPAKSRLERLYNEDEPNLLKLRQDVANAINVERQLVQHLKSLERKQFGTGEKDRTEMTNLESQLEKHRQVKDALKAQLADRESNLQNTYDEKPGALASIFSEPKNAFALVVLVVILTVLFKLLQI